METKKNTNDEENWNEETKEEGDKKTEEVDENQDERGKI